MDHLAPFGGVAVDHRPRRHENVAAAGRRRAGRSARRCRPSRSARRCNTSPARRSTTSCSAAGRRTAGLKINEYGVFRGEKQIAGRTEEDVYATLDLPCFPPELREARQEFEWADAGKLPELVELGDIRGDLHMHSTWTDGTASDRGDGRRRAKSRGLKYIAITDHSKRVTMVDGLDAEAAAQAMGRNRQAQRAAQRHHRPQGRRGRHPRTRRAGPARRRAGRGRLGRGQRPLRPEAVARADHAAGDRGPGESARRGDRPSDRPDALASGSRTRSTWTP